MDNAPGAQVPFTEAELGFMRRMAVHVARGLSFDLAAEAVKADDERLLVAFFDRGTSRFAATPDERGSSYYTGERVGDVMRRDLTRVIYRSLRATVPA